MAGTLFTLHAGELNFEATLFTGTNLVIALIISECANYESSQIAKLANHRLRC